jgi:GNAT superfamily N-acetyltransferase
LATVEIDLPIPVVHVVRHAFNGAGQKRLNTVLAINAPGRLWLSPNRGQSRNLTTGGTGPGSHQEESNRVKDLQIVPFTTKDILFGKRLSDAEDWDITTADLERLTRLEPKGSFKAVIDEEDVGTTACVVFGRVAWIHSVVVRKDFRGLGVGDALMRTCLDFLKGSGVDCVKLDSERGVEPFYERFGFRREFFSMRYVRGGGSFRTSGKRLGPADYEDIYAFDRTWTGLDRRRALKAIFEDFPQSGFIVRNQGKMSGYVMVRKGRRWDSIGPCVVSDADGVVAQDLLQAALNSAPAGKFRACVGGFNRASCKLMEGLGFRKESHCTRMFLGKSFRESDATFAMISAQKG